MCQAKTVLCTERVVAHECVAAVIVWQVLKAVHFERVVEVFHEGADEIETFLVTEVVQGYVHLVLMDNLLQV